MPGLTREKDSKVREYLGSCPVTDLVSGCIQDEFSPNSVVLRTAVIKQRVGKVGHSFVAQRVPTAEEQAILEKHRQKRGIKERQEW